MHGCDKQFLQIFKVIRKYIYTSLTSILCWLLFDYGELCRVEEILQSTYFLYCFWSLTITFLKISVFYDCNQKQNISNFFNNAENISWEKSYLWKSNSKLLSSLRHRILLFTMLCFYFVYSMLIFHEIYFLLKLFKYFVEIMGL